MRTDPAAPYQFCSQRCRDRDLRARRRARQHGATLTPGRRYEVFERDAWICQLCGGLVERDALVPEDQAPVIDHVIALALGGEHGPDNWQTAHFLCNSLKGGDEGLAARNRRSA